VILNTGHDPKAPIMLGQPFLQTVKALIYIASANMCFDINGKKRRFSFNPPYPRRHSSQVNRASLDEVDSIEIVKTRFYQEPVIKGWQDVSWPVKKGDPSHPIILVSIGPNTLEVVCDLGAGVNIIPMSVYDNVL